jgi:hypothetical protein
MCIIEKLQSDMESDVSESQPDVDPMVQDLLPPLDWGKEFALEIVESVFDDVNNGNFDAAVSFLSTQIFPNLDNGILDEDDSGAPNENATRSAATRLELLELSQVDMEFKRVYDEAEAEYYEIEADGDREADEFDRLHIDYFGPMVDSLNE